MRRLLGAVALAAVFLGGATFGPSLVPNATAQQGDQAVVIDTIQGGAENGGATIEMLLDQNNRATAVRVTNNLPGSVSVRVLRNGDNLMYYEVFPALTTTMINIPTTPAARIQTFIDPRHGLGGFQLQTMYPAD